MPRWICGCLLIALVPGLAVGQAPKFKTPPVKPPAQDMLKAIDEKMRKLGGMVSILRNQGVRDPGLADVEIYLEAARKLVEHGEFFSNDSGQWTLDVLDRGMLRARFLAAGEMPWALSTGTTQARAYRSRVDGSVQSFAVTLPAAYGKDPAKKWRVDVVLHGRNATITEVKFLRDAWGDKPAPKDQAFVRIDIFGRGNNAYRWAGETDVFEAIEAFLNYEGVVGRGGLPDRNRIVLRGFSMGGAGTWHLGLHWPDRWCVIGPGAGFTTTHGYVGGLPKPLPAPQEECLRIYDAVDYTENAFNVPIVAYSGSEDPQKKAADNIEARIKQLGLSMTHIVAPGLEHKFPPEWQAKADAFYSKYAAKGRPDYADKVRFVTYTLKYPSCQWVEILGLGKHYERALVDAERTENGFTIKTTNIRALHLTLPEGATGEQTVFIDGQKIAARPWVHQSGSLHIYLRGEPSSEGKDAIVWSVVLPQRLLTERAQKPQKVHGMTGPIDDAFTDAFLCVRGTGKPWHEATEKYAAANLERFQKEWSKYMRGTLPIKDDVDVTSEDIASKHLVLFGDPSSNSLIAQVAGALPLKWDSKSVSLAGKSGSASDHVPVLIHPCPLNANRYVVLNSGHTFHAAEFKGTNALLYPRLGDYALLKLAPTSTDPAHAEAVTAGLFDEYWRMAK